MRTIELTQGKISLVDDKNYERCLCVLWHFHNGYARNRQLGYLHHFILYYYGQVDHKDRDGLNNQEYNLRVATTAQNNQNATKRNACSSNFKGVCFYKAKQNWCAYINKDGKRLHLGFFESEIEAAQAYNVAALQFFGEFARLNLWK